MNGRSFAGSALAFVTLLGAACLPIDTRPPPGLVVVSMSSDDTSGGMTTADSWLVRYERLLIGAGNFGIAEGPCVQYAEGHYVRILDLLQRGPQKLAQVRALGTCPFIFEIRTPPENAVLGAGVTAETKAFLRAPGSDPWVRDRGTTLHVAGTATKGPASVRFAWSFRENHVYGDGSCGEVTFESEVTTSLEIHVRTAALFDDLEAPAGSPASRFEPYAAADADADGEVTLEELDAVPVAGNVRFPTLGARLYQKTVAELFTIRDVTCVPAKFTEE